jgi:hypothetical protein
MKFERVLLVDAQLGQLVQFQAEAGVAARRRSSQSIVPTIEDSSATPSESNISTPDPTRPTFGKISTVSAPSGVGSRFLRVRFGFSLPSRSEVRSIRLKKNGRSRAGPLGQEQERPSSKLNPNRRRIGKISTVSAPSGVGSRFLRVRFGFSLPSRSEVPASQNRKEVQTRDRATQDRSG